uniref:Uncharacterized protein n=1 Tax=Oryza brachyantha TaxID=4533 RepID=J3LHX1_ORYBR
MQRKNDREKTGRRELGESMGNDPLLYGIPATLSCPLCCVLVLLRSCEVVRG